MLDRSRFGQIHLILRGGGGILITYTGLSYITVLGNTRFVRVMIGGNLRQVPMISGGEKEN